MIEYHKIQSLFMRDMTKKHKPFIEGLWAIPELEYLANNQWVFTEKVDGTNVRIGYDGSQVVLGGRNDGSHMPLALVHRLQSLFPVEKLSACFPEELDLVSHKMVKPNIVLFGEGYGARIQKGGGNYNPSGCDFVLFDVYIGGLYLKREDVVDIAHKLDIAFVPSIGAGTLYDAIAMAKEGIKSMWGDFQAEGIVARPAVELQTRRGHRIITKVKCRDFSKLEVPNETLA